jgi:hypothetical protein
MLLARQLATGIQVARIIGVFPLPADSHVITPRVLMLELAGREH